MNGSTTPKPNLYALLIGIDCYLPNLLPDGKTFRSLGGCVRDITHVADFLTRKQALPLERILRLTSTTGSSGEPIEKTAQLPSYENMVAAFKTLTNRANKGDHVYIHYAGHGGRAKTTREDIKGVNGIDETLVPYNIGQPAARYLRDFELAALLQAMVKKGLIVTAVLDSCHSGGMVRGDADVEVRGLDTIDATPRPAASDASSARKLAQTWSRLTAGGTRDVSLGSGWLPEPEGYTLLAACRPSESALEYAFNGKEREGVLTHWLLDSLQDIGPSLSYKVVHDRVLAKIHSQFEQQTPQLQGEGERAVFGSDRVQAVYAVPVLRVEAAHQRVLINAGQAQNVRKGSSFVIYPLGVADFSDAKQRLAVVEIAEDPGATESWAKIVKTLSNKPIEQGAQAVLVSTTKLVRKIALVRQTLSAAIDQQAALKAVEKALPGNGWIELAANKQEIVYQVAVNQASEYEIWDTQGKEIANITPRYKISDPIAAAGIVRRLVHLAKYHSLVEFANHNELSPLAHALVVELAGKRDEYDSNDAFVATDTFAETGGAKLLKVGQWTALRIKNGSSKPLNVTVVNLRPSWEVKQVFPAGEGDYFVQFAPGQEILIPLKGGLTHGKKTGRDILKVFAATGASNYRWLELPTLDEAMTRNESVRNRLPENPLEELLSAFSDDRPRTRDLIPATYPGNEWVTEQVALDISAQ